MTFKRILTAIYIYQVLMFCSILMASSSISAANHNELHGSGATFPALVYHKWSATFSISKNVHIDYLAVGSGEGIRRIEAQESDFGASDMPIDIKELNTKKLLQMPMLLGAITPVINLPGVFVAQLKLDGTTLADIFLGKINTWDDPVLRALNPDLLLPKMKIITIHREEKSGTTFNFTNYLSKVSSEWRNKLGEGLSVAWPVGLAAKGNSGVALKISETKGSIGYIDYADAMEKHLDYVQLKNHDGYYVRPNAGSTRAAAEGAVWNIETGFYQVLTNVPGKASWPITATTYILLRKESVDIDKTRLLLKFMDWNYRNGELYAMYHDFVMMPPDVMDKVRLSWKSITDASGKSAW